MAQNFVGSNNINLLYPSGQFGCLDPETEILLWDDFKFSNITKKAKNIQIGDILVGDDGEMRTVLQLTNGIDDMYKITDINNNTFTANKEHILTLYFKDNNKIKWRESNKRWYFKYFNGYTIKTEIIETEQIKTKEQGYLMIRDIQKQIKEQYGSNNIIDIKIKDYINLYNCDKKDLYQISNLNNINWKSKTTYIDPYLFGSLLSKYDNYISDDLIFNDRNIRLQFLAGFIDTNGILINKYGLTYYEISLTNFHENIINSLGFISKSLGFMSKVITTDDQTIITMTINGKYINNIPTRKYSNYLFNTNNINSNFLKFDIVYIGKSKFCGWSVDKNERFLLGNFIVTHNSRLVGGKDAASPRYTFTYLAELTRLIFRPEDDPILEYLNDDGTTVEPEWFCPIIPMVLVNGADGIGTGYSTTISQFNPLDIVENIKILMNKSDIKKLKRMDPYFRNFNGTVEYIKPSEYIVKGTYIKISSDTIKITELPVGIWTTPYNEFIEKKSEKVKTSQQLIQSYKKAYTDETIDFTLKIDDDILDKLERNGQIYSKLKLSSSLKLSNMHLYDDKGSIKKYDNVLDILTKFYEIRLQMYTKRKQYLIAKLEKELMILKYKRNFIEDVLQNVIIIYKQKKINIINKLIELKYPPLSLSVNSDNEPSYDYITDIPLFNLTEEKINELYHKYNVKIEELKKVTMSIEVDEWALELDEFVIAYKQWIITHSNLDKKGNKNAKTKSSLNTVSKSKTTVKQKI